MHKKSFWWGYAAGLVPVVGLGGAFYFLFMHQPDISLAEMELIDLNGVPISAAQLAGQPVVVNYWATWCAPCVAEFPMFEQARQQAGPRVTFLMASDEPAAKIQAFARKHSYGFRFLRVRRPLPGVNVRPVTYAFDKTGALVGKVSGSLSMAEIKALIPAP